MDEQQMAKQIAQLEESLTPSLIEANKQGEKISELLKQLAASESRSVCRWIRAGERLPKYPGNPQIHYRIDGFHKVQGNFHYSIDDERCEGEIVFTVVGQGLYADYQIPREKWSGLEWLEEIPADQYNDEIKARQIQIEGLLASNKEWGEKYAEACRQRDLAEGTLDHARQLHAITCSERDDYLKVLENVRDDPNKHPAVRKPIENVLAKYSKPSKPTQQ